MVGWVLGFIFKWVASADPGFGLRALLHRLVFLWSLKKKDRERNGQKGYKTGKKSIAAAWGKKGAKSTALPWGIWTKGLNGRGAVGKAQGVSCNAGIQEQSVLSHFHNTQETPKKPSELHQRPGSHPQTGGGTPQHRKSPETLGKATLGTSPRQIFFCKDREGCPKGQKDEDTAGA